MPWSPAPWSPAVRTWEGRSREGTLKRPWTGVSKERKESREGGKVVEDYRSQPLWLSGRPSSPKDPWRTLHRTAAWGARVVPATEPQEPW